LHVAGGVGGSGAERMPSDVGGDPGVGPVLPMVGTGGWLQLRLLPVAFAGEADLDAGDRALAGPGLAADGVGPGVEGRAGCGSVMRARTRMRLTISCGRSGHWYM